MTSPHPRLPAARARLAAILAGCLSLSACSSDGGGDWLSMVKAVSLAWENRDAPVGLQDAASVPYATIGVRIDGGREQIVILATDNGGQRLWTSAARIAITTRGGRIVSSSGFGTDLTGHAAANPGPETWTAPHSYDWTADFADLGRYGVPVHCALRPAGPDPVTILGKQLDTIRVDETCQADSLDWTFSNAYWVSPESGRVWRAIQHIHPKGPELEIEILRPPLSPG